ncbi:hypothetical protein DJ021_03285 [Phenylobacterium hankyongense]|uniref:Uncharacterized protein n=1 Tax=Phenylobacterium hankyongense TaxID=1813876 RepID=A0A328AXK1_9CAUL|nr:DUF6559 family protein [Phenylobacterium hankyongense]RAK58891.1 hypothetical protein DJ021_03285 [Phenylobacterium hankyongense]
MGWLQRIAMHRAAKTYARRLPAEMHRGWGAADFYTPGQVRAAVAHLGLNRRYIVIAYAAFLAEDEFATAASETPVSATYAEARRIFGRYCPRGSGHTYWHVPISNEAAASRYGVGAP